MTFTKEEMIAIFKLAKMMALADGKVTQAERDCIFTDLQSFGVKGNTLESVAIEEAAKEMDPANAIRVVAAMTKEEKKYVCGYMAAVMISDGNIDEKEKSLWALVSLLAGFPTMNIHEAVSFWQKH